MSHVVDRPSAEAGRAALARHDWQEAFDALAAADAAGELSAEELILLADAAWWVGRMNDSIDARERAFGFGKGGVIGATETNSADFPFCIPYGLTMKRIKVTLGTAASGAMVVQLRKASNPGTGTPSYADVSGFSVTFVNGGQIAVADPADVAVSEGDLMNFSASTGSGQNLFVEVVHTVP